MKMDRRTFIATLAASGLSLPALAEPSPIYPEGEMIGEDFFWKTGGGNPLRLSPKEALEIERLNLPRRIQQELLEVIRKPPAEVIDLRNFEGDIIGDVMIGGRGVLRPRVRPITAKWPNGRSTMAKVWGWFDSVTGDEGRIIIADVCKNILLTRWGAPIVCDCDPQLGDACA